MLNRLLITHDHPLRKHYISSDPLTSPRGEINWCQTWLGNTQGVRFSQFALCISRSVLLGGFSQFDFSWANFCFLECQREPWVSQISSVSAYITQFKMPNTHRISFPREPDTHVKFSERNETQLIFTSTFRLCRVSLFFQYSTAPLDTMFTVSECKRLVNSTWVTSRAEQVYSAGLDILDIVRVKITERK